MDYSISEIIFQLAVLLFSIVLHEVSHGYAALFLGDRTAYYAGRLTLNPIKHLDPMGSFLVPLLTSMFGMPFGWAKPVPYNPYNLRNQKWGPAIVGAAGPVANLLLTICFGLIIRFLPMFSHAIPGDVFFRFMEIAYLIAFINLFLALFNLLPIPPLDGSKLLFALMPYRWHTAQLFLEQYGIFILFFFIYFGGSALLGSLASIIFYGLVGSYPL